MQRRSVAAAALATLVGFVCFLWPFVLAPGKFGSAYTAPLMFGVLLLLVLAVVFAEIADGGIDAKALAMLGVLSALNAALRPLGAGTAGIELVFFTLVFAGRVFGPGFGFTLGCTSLFASAIITGGVGPWMPYQMFGCAWVGMFAGLLPQCRGSASSRCWPRTACSPATSSASCSICSSGRSRSIPVARSRTCPVPPSRPSCTVTSCSTRPPRSAGTPAARSPTSAASCCSVPPRSRPSGGRRGGPRSGRPSSSGPKRARSTGAGAAPDGIIGP